MKNKLSTLQTLSLIVSIANASSSFAFQCRPEVLSEILDNASESVVHGGQPVVLFDLDDTLIDTRRRSYGILKELARDEEFKSKYAMAAYRLEWLGYQQVRYQISDTFRDMGISEAEAIEYATNFWAPRFFSNEYAARDMMLAGAADYVRKLHRKGAVIVYLTGRDEPRMGEGTRESLVRNGFPIGDYRSFLMLKPTAKADDLEFKRSVFAKVRSMGEVVAAFENEPANLNAMAAAFPDSLPVFLDTIHSPKPDQPGADVSAVRNYLEGGGCH